MNNRLLLSALAIGILATGAAQAQTQTHTSAPDQDARAKALFTTLDTNTDGQLSADELGHMREAMQQKMFAKADTNGNGKIDADEFKAHAIQQAAQRAERMFAHLDKDKDGVISPEEMQNARHGKKHRGHHAKSSQNQGPNQEQNKTGHKRHTPEDMLKKMDTDGNGSVSLEEWQAASTKWHQRHHDMKSHDSESDSH